MFAAAREASMFISGDGRISESNMAMLIGYSPGHLKQLRTTGRGPPAYRLGLNGCRVSYSIAEVAAWIEEQREI